MIHQRTYTGEKLYKCEACPKRFAGNSLTLVKSNTYKFEICSRSFATNSIVTVHMELILVKSHTNVRHALIARNSDFIVHKRTHAVKTCSRSFASKSEVTRHEKTYLRCGEKYL